MLVRRRLLAAGLLLPFAAQASAALLSQLRGGGLNMFFRASLTGRANPAGWQGDPKCAVQRNLTDAGRQAAQDLGAAIRELGIPIGDVLSSPFCRCVDTATLAFGRASVVAWLEADGVFTAPLERARLAALAYVFRAAPRGGNRMLFGDDHNLYGLHEVYDWPDLLPIAEGECRILRPAESPEVLGRVAHDGWRGLAA
jgi:hypothetical protein